MVITVTAAAKIAEKLTSINLNAAPLSLALQTDADLAWVDNLHAKAFGPGRFARTAFRVREKLEIDHSMCLIARLENKSVGSVWMTPISLSKVNGYLLGPLATDPEFQNIGIGKLLVKSVSELAFIKRPAGYILLVGDAPYYAPLGFEVVGSRSIVFPGPVDPKRVLVLSRQPTHARELAGVIAKP